MPRQPTTFVNNQTRKSALLDLFVRLNRARGSRDTTDQTPVELVHLRADNSWRFNQQAFGNLESMIEELMAKQKLVRKN